MLEKINCNLFLWQFDIKLANSVHFNENLKKKHFFGLKPFFG